MVWKQPKQSPDYKESFSDLVNLLLAKKGWTTAFLAKKSNLSKTTISRIKRNSNDKGSTYQATERVVAAISLGFCLDRAGWEKLYGAAFPDRAIWLIGLDRHYSVTDVNELLYDAGLPLLDSLKNE